MPTPFPFWRSARKAGDRKTFLLTGSKRRECVIKNMSLTGVRLCLLDAMPLPTSFRLLVDDVTIAECEIVWRRGAELGASIRGMSRR